MMKNPYHLSTKKRRVSGPGKVNWWRGFFVALFILLCAFPSPGQPENEKSNVFHWEFSIGGTSYYVSSDNYWNFGPELTVQYAFTNTHGIYVSISYPTIMMTSRGYGFREGFPFDGGVWLSPKSVQSLFKLGAGLSYIFGSDSDGSAIRGFGAHISTQASYWFIRNVGVWARGVFRLWLGERSRYESKFSPSFSAGIGFRF